MPLLGLLLELGFSQQRLHVAKEKAMFYNWLHMHLEMIVIILLTFIQGPY
jgi:hypothetical protein